MYILFLSALTNCAPGLVEQVLMIMSLAPDAVKDQHQVPNSNDQHYILRTDLFINELQD